MTRIFSKNNKRWFHQWMSAKWFLQKAPQWQWWLGLLALMLLMIGTVWGLAIAPEEKFQGNSYRIIFIHVPAAILAQSIYVMMAIAGVVLIVWRVKLSTLFITQSASIGASFGILAIVTGAIWGKPTWGTWWFPDARIISTLILVFLYWGIIALHSALKERDIAGKAIAILAVVGSINIPIIKYSVEWWYTLHQPATFSVTGKMAMPMSMWLPLLIMVLGYYCFFGYCILRRMSNQIQLNI